MDVLNGMTLLTILRGELERLPFELLQSFSIIGGFSVFLVLHENVQALLKRSSWSMGVTVGIVCILFRFLLVRYLGESVPPASSVLTAIFLAGTIGGLPNAMISFLIVSAGYLLIGDAVNEPGALLSYFSFAVGGSIAHHFIIRYFSEDFRLFRPRTIFFLITGCFLSAELSLGFVWLFETAPSQHFPQLFIERMVSSFSVSAIMIIAMMLIFLRVIQREKHNYTDANTGLANRRALQEHLDTLYKEHNGTVPSAVILLNVDNFHALIKAYGHAWLDSLYREIAFELDATREHSLLRKYGTQLFVFSDHSFVIVLPNIDKEMLEEQNLPHQLLTEIYLFTQKEENTLQPLFTVNVMDIHLGNENTPTRLLRTLTFLEECPCGTVQFFESDITQQVLLEEKLYTIISSWLATNSVPLYLQPKINLATGECCGAEALLRVVDPDTPQRYIPPHTVLLTAEKCGLSTKVEWAIINTATDMIAALPPCLGHLKIAVNITPNILATENFTEDLIALLNEKNILAEQLVLEIVETHSLITSDIVHKNIAQLIAHKVRLSLDDFGTGYSSLSLLARYQFDELKIDYAMTSRSNEPRIYSAIQLAVASAQKYNADVVAEGIETEEQRKRIEKVNIAYGQGYLFAKAMSFDNFLKYIELKNIGNH